MIRNMIVETIPIVGYEVTPCKHTGHLKKKNLLRNVQIQTPITPSPTHQQQGVIPLLLPLVPIFT